jgi:hypothetical protein
MASMVTVSTVSSPMLITERYSAGVIRGCFPERPIRIDGEAAAGMTRYAPPFDHLVARITPKPSRAEESFVE